MTPSPHHSDGEEWPVQKLCRSGAGHLYIPAPSMRATDAQTYHPESAPNVLSPEEAWLVGEASRAGIPVEEYPRYEAILDRLASYGKEHHAEH